MTNLTTNRCDQNEFIFGRLRLSGVEEIPLEFILAEFDLIIQLVHVYN